MSDEYRNNATFAEVVRGYQDTDVRIYAAFVEVVRTYKVASPITPPATNRRDPMIHSF